MFQFMSVQLCHHGIGVVSVGKGFGGAEVGLFSAVVVLVVGPTWRRG